MITGLRIIAWTYLLFSFVMGWRLVTQGEGNLSGLLLIVSGVIILKIIYTITGMIQVSSEKSKKLCNTNK